MRCTMMCSQRLDRRASRCARLGVTSVAEPPLLVSRAVGCAAAAAPGELARRPRRCAALRAGGSACAGRPTALPPAAPPSMGEGDLWGDLQAVGRETGSLLRLLKNPTHPQPLPVREGAVPTPRPPVGGSEEVRAEGSVFSSPRRDAAGPSDEEFHHGFRSCRTTQCTPGRRRAAGLRARAATGPVSKATLTAISNTRKGSGDNRGEEATAIQWTLWGKQAENAAQYLGKGSHVNVVGRVQNNNYERDGETVYAMAFTAEEIDYLDTKAEGEALRAKQGAGADDGAPAPASEAGRARQPTKPARSRKAAAKAPAPPTSTRRHPVLNAPGREPCAFRPSFIPSIPTIEGTDMYYAHPHLATRFARNTRVLRSDDAADRRPDARRRAVDLRRRASTPAAPSATPTSRPSTSCAACARRASSPSWSRRARAASKARPSSPST